MLRIVLFTLAGGIAGFLLGATGASIFAAVTRMSRMEGGVGAFAAGIGVLAGLLGAILTFVYMLRSRGVGGSVLALGTLAVVAGVPALLGIARWRYTHSQAYFTKKYSSVPLQFELAYRGNGSPSHGVPAVELMEDGQRGEAVWDASHALSGSVYLYRLTTKRELIVREPGESPVSFSIVLPRDPSRGSRDWSSWVNAAAGEKWSMRYRVQR